MPLARQDSPAALPPAAERPGGTEWLREARYIDGGGGIWTSAGVSAGTFIAPQHSSGGCMRAHVVNSL